MGISGRNQEFFNLVMELQSGRRIIQLLVILDTNCNLEVLAYDANDENDSKNRKKKAVSL